MLSVGVVAIDETEDEVENLGGCYLEKFNQRSSCEAMQDLYLYVGLMGNIAEYENRYSIAGMHSKIAGIKEIRFMLTINES